MGKKDPQKGSSASMRVGRDGKTQMKATDKDGNTVEMTGDGTSGRTQTSRDGNVVQTDGNQTVIDD